MRGGEKFYQRIDNTRKKNQTNVAEQKSPKTMENIHKQCSENKMSWDLNG